MVYTCILLFFSVKINLEQHLNTTWRFMHTKSRYLLLSTDLSKAVVLVLFEICILWNQATEPFLVSHHNFFLVSSQRLSRISSQPFLVSHHYIFSYLITIVSRISSQLFVRISSQSISRISSPLSLVFHHNPFLVSHHNPFLVSNHNLFSYLITILFFYLITTCSRISSEPFSRISSQQLSLCRVAVPPPKKFSRIVSNVYFYIFWSFETFILGTRLRSTRG